MTINENQKQILNAVHNGETKFKQLQLKDCLFLKNNGYVDSQNKVVFLTEKGVKALLMNS